MSYPLFSTERVHRLAPGMVLDIVAELAYWRSCYPHRRFFHDHLPFETYVPTFKFGYDTYLIHHHEQLAELVPMLRRRYTVLNERDQLQWTDAMAIVRATWKRMGVGPS
ncbi:MAG: hypothetical protein ABWY01_00695 [Pseudoxanthomonas sp.]